MPDIFSKSLQEITAADVQALVDEAYPENSTVEFKERLPNKGGDDDSWYTGESSISDRARNEILEEVIALANTHGGHVILGVRETDDQPHRAAGIESIPRCDALAERLRYHLRDGVDPQIPQVHAYGVRTNGDSGVVVLRVPQSRMAPHRHKWTNHCYRRHADRTEKMTMREIQDLTLRISHGLDGIEAIYKKHSEKFQHYAEMQEISSAIRVTLIPLSPLYAERVYGSHQLFSPWHQFTLVINNSPFRISFPCLGQNERPILRGAQRSCSRDNVSIFQEAYTDGLIELRFFLRHVDSNLLHVEWILAAICNGLVHADQFRRTVGSPDVEYGLEFELYSEQVGGIDIRGLGELHLPTRIKTHLVDSPCIFPRYPYGGQDNLGKLLEVIVRDIYDAIGAPAPTGGYNLTTHY